MVLPGAVQQVTDADLVGSWLRTRLVSFFSASTTPSAPLLIARGPGSAGQAVAWPSRGAVARQGSIAPIRSAALTPCVRVTVPRACDRDTVMNCEARFFDD